jgi:hypothetical protein
MTAAKTSLSKPQLGALLTGVDHRLLRAASDWVYRQEVNGSDPIRFGVMGRFGLSTIRCLHERGLMSANFDGPRLHCGCWDIESATWSRERYPSGRPLVWTNSLGRELLCEKGLLPAQFVDNVIPFPTHRVKRNNPSPLRREDEIIDLASYRLDQDSEYAFRMACGST